METNQVVFCVIVFLVIVIIVLAYYGVKNSKEVKRLYLNNKLRDALNKGITINFNEYSLAALEFFENQINDSFVQIFEKRIEDVAYLIKSIDRVKDYAKREYLKNLITATVINRVEVKKLAKLIFTNMSDYLRYIKINKFHLSSELIEAESIRYLKFNSFILLNLNAYWKINKKSPYKI